MKNRKFIFSLLAIIFIGLVYGTIREMELLINYQFAITGILMIIVSLIGYLYWKQKKGYSLIAWLSIYAYFFIQYYIIFLCNHFFGWFAPYHPGNTLLNPMPFLAINLMDWVLNRYYNKNDKSLPQQ